MTQAVHKSARAMPDHAARFYLPELDVLRFFAFFGVFLFHVPVGGAATYESYGLLGSIGTAGAFGVDLFFTLSGYLLTSLLIRERVQTGDINMKAFYARRTLRIWPLYYFSIALAFLLTQIPASIVSAPPYLGDAFPPMHLGTYFFMAIFLFNFNFGNSLLVNPMPFMDHLWSISVEEQFYLFWPWLVRYIPRRRIVVVPIVMIAVACLTRAMMPLNLQHAPVWNNTFTRLDPIAVGILIALMPKMNPQPALRSALVVLGVVSWMFAAYYCGLPHHQNSNLSVSMGYPAVAVGSGAFVLATLGAKSLRTNTAIVRGLIYLGKISYGLYVYNQIALPIAKLFLFRGVLGIFLPAGSNAFWLYVLFAFGLNVAMAAASYRWLEAPFLRLKQRFARIPSRSV